MKRNIIDWTGHVVRMDQARTLKIFESKPGESRRRRRPRFR